MRVERFQDGSSVSELEGGSYLIRESRQARALELVEQPAPYNEPAPQPKRRINTARDLDRLSGPGDRLRPSG